MDARPRQGPSGNAYIIVCGNKQRVRGFRCSFLPETAARQVATTSIARSRLARPASRPTDLPPLPMMLLPAARIFWIPLRARTAPTGARPTPERKVREVVRTRDALERFLRQQHTVQVLWVHERLSFCNSTIGANFLDLGGGSGAPSFVYSKPYWQTNVPGIPNDGKRDLPDVSLFASNAFWQHAVLFCMSDAAQGGAPCDYTNPTDTLFNSAGGTSFTAPQFASIQALINQKAGAPQGNPDPIFYNLARANTEALPTRTRVTSQLQCIAGQKIVSSCVFHDVTAGKLTRRASVPITVTILRRPGTEFCPHRIRP